MSKLDAILWILAFLYLFDAVLGSAFPSFSEVPLEPFILLAFGILHGWKRYGWGRLFVFLGLVFLISSFSEGVSLAVGVPFGRYHYNTFIGPKLFSLPVLVSVTYLGFGYVSWVLSTKLIGDVRQRFGRLTLLAVPLVASFVLSAWDVCFDPTLSTVKKWWVWEQGGGYFGVPLSNFFGWFLTAYVFYQLFAVLLWYFGSGSADESRLTKSFSYSSAFVYAGSTLAFAAQYYFGQNISVADAVGHIWQTSEIYEAAFLSSVYFMLFIGILASIKIAQSGKGDKAGKKVKDWKSKS